MTKERLVARILAHPEAEAVIKTAHAKLNNAKRLTRSGGRNGGRPIVLRPCPVCQQPFGARAIREHIRSHNCSCGTGARGECIVHSGAK